VGREKGMKVCRDTLKKGVGSGTPGMADQGGDSCVSRGRRIRLVSEERRGSPREFKSRDAHVP